MRRSTASVVAPVDRASSSVHTLRVYGLRSRAVAWSRWRHHDRGRRARPSGATRGDSWPSSSWSVCGAAIAVWILARGDLVGADARAYWGGVRLWLGGGDPLDPPPPYLPYVYWPWSLPHLRALGGPSLGDGLVHLSRLQRPALRLERWRGPIASDPLATARPGAARHTSPRRHARYRQHHLPLRDGHLGRALRLAPHRRHSCGPSRQP